MTLTIKKARTIIKTALAKGREAGMKPLSVVVVDAGGHTIAFEREDGAAPGRYALAQRIAADAGTHLHDAPHELVAWNKRWIQICISPRIPAFNMKIGSADTSFENFNFYITRTSDRLRYLS